MIYEFAFATQQHHQFYICDKRSARETDSERFWTEKAVEDRLAVEDGILGISTVYYGPVKGELVVLERDISIESPELYDHMVEGSVQILSGLLQILDCPNSNVELEIKIKPDTYRARIYYSTLCAVQGNENEDYCRIEMWPSRFDEVQVLKKYVSNQ